MDFPIKPFLATTVAVCLTGCAATKSDLVEKRMVLPPFAATMTLEDRQGFLMAAPIEAPMPVFPGRVQGPDMRTEVCVELMIREDGTVGEARHIPGVETCDMHPDPGYLTATLDAVRRWTFFAAAICDFPEGVEKTDDCSGDGVVVRAVPIKLMYAFAFERVGGQGRVGLRRRSDRAQ